MLDKHDQCTGFDLISAKQPKWLILGTMPSIKSLQAEFYYAHPQNAFWPIMGQIMQRPVATQAQQRALIETSHLMLWDVLGSCQRSGSLDAAIKQPKANDFERLFKTYPSLSMVLFNGKKAYQLYQQHVLAQQKVPKTLSYKVMPSTSPANASWRFVDKQLFWQEVFSAFSHTN